MKAKKVKKIPFRLKTQIPHCRSIWIGILQGTWRDMGIQYGQRCGEDIAWGFDVKWKDEVLRGTRPWHKGRTEEERAEYCTAYVQRSFKELSYLSPELIAFLEGIAEGAAQELDKCIYADACSHFVKVALLNFAGVRLHPDWDFSKDGPGTMKTGKKHGQVLDHDCNGFWVKGAATKTGETYATRTAQSVHIKTRGFTGRERQVAYVAIPKDPKAQVFWGSGRAGNLGGLGAGLMNDRGVCCLTAGAQKTDAWAQADETAAPGIKDFLLAIHGVIFSKTAREAAAIATVGTPGYRRLTARNAVLRARGCSIVFADPKDAVCVEQNALHYAMRKPGDLGEKGGDYIVIANHFKFKDGSFDEHNVFQQNEPMTKFCPEKERDDSYYRFWSGMWMLHNNYGKIDRDMVMQEFVTAHYAYDKAGKRYDPDPDTGKPAVQGTFCEHEPPFTKENPMGMGGNADTSVFNLSTQEVWWVPVWPCHHKEWNLSWNYLNLKPLSEYRKKLWGY